MRRDLSTDFEFSGRRDSLSAPERLSRKCGNVERPYRRPRRNPSGPEIAMVNLLGGLVDPSERRDARPGGPLGWQGAFPAPHVPRPSRAVIAMLGAYDGLLRNPGARRYSSFATACTRPIGTLRSLATSRGFRPDDRAPRMTERSYGQGSSLRGDVGPKGFTVMSLVESLGAPEREVQASLLNLFRLGCVADEVPETWDSAGTTSAGLRVHHAKAIFRPTQLGFDLVKASQDER